MFQKVWAVLLVAGLLVAVALPVTGCQTAEDERTATGTDNAEQETQQPDNIITDPPTTSDEPEPGNDKLSSRLRALIEAEDLGELKAFAQLGSFDLVGDSVRVSIESMPGQLEAAVEVIGRYGIVEIVSERWESVLALIPVTN